MFRWTDSLGLTGAIGTMRNLAGFDRYLPDWIVYSLPFALWVSSYVFLIGGGVGFFISGPASVDLVCSANCHFC